MAMLAGIFFIFPFALIKPRVMTLKDYIGPKNTFSQNSIFTLAITCFDHCALFLKSKEINKVRIETIKCSDLWLAN